MNVTSHQSARPQPWALVLLLAWAGSAAWGAESAPVAKSPITHQALWLLKQVGAPVPSPDGRWVVVPVGEPAYDEKDESADLWLIPGDGSTPPRRFTAVKGRESSPAWSPDSGRIAFTAKREGDEVPQIYVIDVVGGEARRLAAVALGAREPQWSPDGRWLLFQSGMHRGATNDASNQRLAEDRRKAKSKVRAYDGFPVRRWDKWIDDVQTHLWIVPVDGSAPPRSLLAGTRLVAAAGFRGAGDEGSADSLQARWVPDGRSILITATTNMDVAARDTPVFRLFEVRTEESMEPRALTPPTFNAAGAAFTPDGRWLLFTTNGAVGRVYEAHDRLVSAAWPWDGAPTEVASGFDRSVAAFACASDSQRVYFTAEDAGHVRVWSAPIDGGAAQLELDPPEGVWGAPRIAEKAAGPVLFANWEAAHQPGEVFRVELATRRQRRLSAFNDVAVGALDLPPLKGFWFTNSAGRRLHSFLVLPPAFDPARKYPLLALIHGGHASMWRDSVTRRWNYHLLAAPGYVVLLTDYMGSTGYGEQFTRGIQGDPLRGPADDINAAVEEAIDRFPFIDGTRLAAGGASYGGHLANWLEASTTRYKCLISHAGLASLYAQWGTSDAVYHRELMMRGPFWERPEAWLEHSPATYAARFRTPMLLSVGENDFRVPLNNVLEMWSLLQRQQVPSRLLVWPDENHWILKGENSRVFYQEVHAWLARWLGDP